MNEQPMMHALKQSSLHALLILLSKALTREGFGDVQILDRRQDKQKSRFSGHEVLCESSVGQVPFRMVVKVIRKPFRRDMFDQLAGVVVRRKADVGMLVNTHQGNEKVMKWQDDYGSHRIVVLDGPKLVQMLARHGVGIRKSGEPDHAFLDALEEQALRIQMFMEAEGI